MAAEQYQNSTMLEQMGPLAAMMIEEWTKSFVKECMEQVLANEDMMKGLALLATILLVARTIWVMFRNGDLSNFSRAAVINGVKESANDMVETANAVEIKAKIQEVVQDGMHLRSNKIVPRPTPSKN